MNSLLKFPGDPSRWMPQVVFKGGESSESTSQNVINDPYKKDVKIAMKELRARYNSGDLSKVAGSSDLQKSAFRNAKGTHNTGIRAIEDARETYEQAQNGEGIFAMSNIDALENAAIDQSKREGSMIADAAASAGVMGGSRAALAAGANDAQLANALAGLKYDQINRAQENAMWGAGAMEQSGSTESSVLTNNLSNLASLGSMQREIKQERVDSSAKGLESYMNALSGMMPMISTQQSKTESSGGK